MRRDREDHATRKEARHKAISNSAERRARQLRKEEKREEKDRRRWRKRNG